MPARRAVRDRGQHRQESSAIASSATAAPDARKRSAGGGEYPAQTEGEMVARIMTRKCGHAHSRTLLSRHDEEECHGQTASESSALATAIVRDASRMRKGRARVTQSDALTCIMHWMGAITCYG